MLKFAPPPINLQILNMTQVQISMLLFLELIKMLLNVICKKTLRN